MMDPENGMVIFEDQEGSQRPDCAMMDPGASSFLMDLVRCLDTSTT